MTNSELSINQLKGISGGSFRLLAQIAKAFVETSGEIDKAKTTGELPERVYEPFFVETQVKEGGCEDPHFPSIG